MKVRPASSELSNGKNDIVVVVPSIERGHFTQTHSRYIDLGEIALLSKIPEEEAQSIREGDEELFRSYYEEDEKLAGRVVILRGAKINVVRDTLANMSMTPGAMEASTMYGSKTLDEFAPYKQPSALNPLFGPLGSGDTR